MGNYLTLTGIVQSTNLFIKIFRPSVIEIFVNFFLKSKFVYPPGAFWVTGKKQESGTEELGIRILGCDNGTI